MYRKLLSYVGKFVFVRQGSFNRYYEGKLLSLDADVLEIQSYKKDGTEEEIWTIALDSISEFSIGGRHLSELELKVSFALSETPVEEDEDSPALPVLLLQGSTQADAILEDAGMPETLESSLEPLDSNNDDARLDEIEN